MPLRAAELEVLFTANVDDIAKAEATVKKTGKDIESKPITQKIGADEKPALAGMDRVEQAAKKLVSHHTAVQIDSNIERAEKGIDRAQKRLDYLRSVETELDVSADIKRAETQLQKLERQRDALTRSREQIEIDADTIPAEDALDKLQDDVTTAGEEGGRAGGTKLVGGIIAALASIPIAGAIVGVAKSVGDAVVEGFEKGLSQEATRDRLAALTGIDAATATRFAYASGEAYANTFGESIEQNMDTSRLALQFQILDEGATTRDAQKTIQGLAGIADVLDEDVRPVASAVATMLRTGIAKNADEAYDILAAGAREGVNRNEDLIDTFTEYPALFKRLGLSGQEALGLVNQGMRAGARNSDLAADALKEFQIRATDASKSSAEGFEALGLNAADMTAKIARGGNDAREGLTEVLDKLRDMEDPVTRNAAAVALFGTQAEDLGDALFAMDLSTAVDELDGVTGAAQRMFDTLQDNDATKLEEAKRNIETAATGIQGALAAAFSEPLGDFAEWVSMNRGPLMEFLLDLANGALDFGEATVEAAASATEAFGGFVSGPLADVVEGIRKVIEWSSAGLADTSGLKDTVAEMRDFDDSTSDAAEKIRDTMLPALEDARGRMNEFAQGAIDQANVHDAEMRTNRQLALVDPDGDVVAQTQAVLDALGEQVRLAQLAGESSDNMTDRYTTTRDALLQQLEAAGYSAEEAGKLVDEEQQKVDDLAERLETMPNGEFTVTAHTTTAEEALDRLIAKGSQVPLEPEYTIGNPVDTIPADQYSAGGRKRSGKGRGFYHGALVEFMAKGSLTSMDPVAQMVPPDTWRVVGDRADVPELYAPLDGSARSWALLMEGLRRMPGVAPMADGGLVGAMRTADGGVRVEIGDIVISGNGLSVADIITLVQQAIGDELRRTFGDRGGL